MINNTKENTNEPVMPCVAAADADPKNIALEENRLRSFIERIEHLEEEKSGIAADIRDVYAEAKAVGYDTKIMRAIIKLRKMDAADRQEQDYLLEAYKKALCL